MPSPLRVLLPDTLCFISSRVEEGLPLVATSYMRAILGGILARAQELYPVKVCAQIFMANHLHMLVVVKEPLEVVEFMSRVKTESSHAINRLLGRRKKTVWEDGYDSPTVLTIEDAIAKFVYLYTNPQTAELVNTIEEYPGLSSWKMFTSGRLTKRFRVIHRPAIQRLPKFELSLSEQRRVTRALLESTETKREFTLSPNAWFACFGVTDAKEIDQYNQQIIFRVRDKEQELIKERQSQDRNVLGAEALIHQPINQQYTPQKFGKRTWCICWDIAKRVSFIDLVKDLAVKGREVLQAWRSGDTSKRYPHGLFPPSMPKLSNIWPADYYLVS